jgi:CubicO group peptidase (beta-lactamase class C family)
VSFVLGPPRPIPPEARDWLHGAAGMVASASDLARWDLGLIDGKVLSRRSLRRMTTAHTLTDGRSTDYGCGIGVRHVAGETVLSHTGAVAGFLAYNAIVPRTRSAVIFLVNTEGGSPGEIHQQVLSLVIGPSTFVPAVKGAPATEVALDVLRQVQRGALDRAVVAPELIDYFEDGGLAEASARLRALGEPSAVEAVGTRARGGMEVTTIRFTFAERSVEAVLFRSPDGIVHQLLLLKD